MKRHLSDICIEVFGSDFFSLPFTSLSTSFPPLFLPSLRICLVSFSLQKISFVYFRLYYRGLKHAARGPHEVRQQCFCCPRYFLKFKKYLILQLKLIFYLFVLTTNAARRAICLSICGTYFPGNVALNCFEFQTPALLGMLA